MFLTLGLENWVIFRVLDHQGTPSGSFSERFLKILHDLTGILWIKLLSLAWRKEKEVEGKGGRKGNLFRTVQYETSPHVNMIPAC